ncbi:MAG: DUF2520 domain-containing protein [Candidatus Aminicenantes bacterium]|nr:DUF2520 domain-containing protein [Candidatus Aminicenantes bacterium]
MKTITIIGAGRLGTSLGTALARQGYIIKALSCRSLKSCRESRRLIGQGDVFTDNLQAASQGQIVFLTPPDDIIPQVAAELASASDDWSHKFVFHCSGLLTSLMLEPLRKLGARTASLHPMQTFASKTLKPQAFREIYFGLEGDAQALIMAQKITHTLGGKHLILQPEDKPLYHTAGSMASNFLVVLFDVAVRFLERLTNSEEEAAAMLFPLVQETLQNVKEFDASSALTGPIIRGDKTTLKKHLEAIQAFPEQKTIYLHLAAEALRMAGRAERLSAQELKEMQALLEEK